MLKRMSYYKYAMVVFALILLMGCSTKEEPVVSETPDAVENSATDTVATETTSNISDEVPSDEVFQKEIDPSGVGDFTELSQADLTEDEKTFVNQISKTAGLYKKGDLIVVALGSKPTGGYHLVFDHQEVHDTGVNLYFNLDEPKEGDFVTQSIIYPIIVGKIKVPIGAEVGYFNAKTGDPLVFQ